MKIIEWAACNSDSPSMGYLCCRLKFHAGKCEARDPYGNILERWDTSEGIESEFCRPQNVTEKELADDGVIFNEKNVKSVRGLINNTDIAVGALLKNE